MPPWVERMRNSGSRRRLGSQPMPAFWLRPKMSPEGWVRSISGVMGSEPSGPGAWVRTVPGSKLGDSRTEVKVMGLGI